jgi:1,4-alpha-glucan branching enzyme
VALVGLVLPLALRTRASVPGPAPASIAAAPSVAAPPVEPLARFELVAPGARSVSLCGEWSGWEPIPLEVHDSSRGTWSVALPLRPGEWRYSFLVDGQRVDDPSAAAFRPDGFGGRNAVISL